MKKKTNADEDNVAVTRKTVKDPDDRVSNLVIKYFAKAKLKYTESPDKKFFSADFNGGGHNNRDLRLTALIDESYFRVAVFNFAEISKSDSDYTVKLERLLDLNRRLRVVKISVDPENGGIILAVEINTVTGKISQEMIDFALTAPMYICERIDSNFELSK
jgi:hypothetical protein